MACEPAGFDVLRVFFLQSLTGTNVEIKRREFGIFEFIERVVIATALNSLLSIFL